MTLGAEHISKALGRLLDQLGEERGGKVACLVLIHSDQVELIYPFSTDVQLRGEIEKILLNALITREGKHK